MCKKLHSLSHYFFFFFLLYIFDCVIGCPDLHNIQPCKLLFGTVMYGYHMDQIPKKIIYSLNFEALHRVFVLQWELQ